MTTSAEVRVLRCAWCGEGQEYDPMGRTRRVLLPVVDVGWLCRVYTDAAAVVTASQLEAAVGDVSGEGCLPVYFVEQAIGGSG